MRKNGARATVSSESGTSNQWGCGPVGHYSLKKVIIRAQENRNTASVAQVWYSVTVRYTGQVQWPICTLGSITKPVRTDWGWVFLFARRLCWTSRQRVGRPKLLVNYGTSNNWALSGRHADLTALDMNFNGLSRIQGDKKS